MAIKLNTAGLIEQTMKVSKLENNVRKELGQVQYYIPTLESAGITAERDNEAEGDELPSYKDEKLAFIFESVVAAVKAKARNALQPQTAELRDGATIADSWDALLAERTGGGNAEALAIVREAKAAFTSWVATTGKSAKAQTFVCQLFANRNALSLQSPEIKEKFSGYLSDFCEQADTALLEKSAKYIKSLEDVCDDTEMAEDF